MNLKHRHFCWSCSISFCHHPNPSHPIPRRPSDFGEANAAKTRSLKKTAALFRQKLNQNRRRFSMLLNRLLGMYQTLWDLPDSYWCQFSCINNHILCDFFCLTVLMLTTRLWRSFAVFLFNLNRTQASRRNVGITPELVVKVPPFELRGILIMAYYKIPM